MSDAPTPEPGTGAPGYASEWHVGRSFGDTRLEDGCPCPKAPCGLVVAGKFDPDCAEHPWERTKTIRQSHPAENCPGARTQDLVPLGSLVRVKPYLDSRDYDAVVGRTYVVVGHVDPDSEMESPAPHYGLGGVGGNYGEWYAPLGCLEVVQTPAERAEAMRLPTLEEIAEHISSEMHSSWGEIEIFETRALSKPPMDRMEPPHPFAHGVEFYGRRRDGVGFGGILRLTTLWETDD